ncbi:MAG: hypothetical protein HUU21_02950 [Polyangiaceae bacterium]|nr:hypothetical protein [Polyangiaceae bacterium]
MSRRSRPCSAPIFFALAALAAAACSGGQAPHFKTASEIPDDLPRKPDGVAIDPASATMAPSDRASTEDGVLTLRSPLGVDLATAMIGEFFSRVVAEDDDGLAELFTRDAIAVTGAPSGGMGQTPGALLWWEQRFRRLDYGKVAGEVMFREAELEVFRPDDVVDAPPHRAIRTDALHDNDVIIRAPIVTPRSGQSRLFGDEIVFWLRRDGDHFKIFRILEDFQVP